MSSATLLARFFALAAAAALAAGSPRPCPERWLACSSGRCVAPHYMCDGVQHCPEGEDEAKQHCGSPRRCPEHHVACSTGLCVPPEFVCDGGNECLDGEDEQLCGSPRACPENYVACSTGKCVLPNFVCDGDKDCPGGEDEDDKLCGSPRPCPEHWLACSTGQCVTPHYICDGLKHCPDNEDEQLCGGLLNTTTTTISKTTGSPRPCPERWLACSSGRCVAPHYMCDGVQHCPEGEDEAKQHCGSPRTCPEHYVACSSGLCAYPSWVCNNVTECPDGEDEQLCGSPRRCPEHHVACSTGLCVPPEFVCDGGNECLDGEDEQLCGSPRACPEHYIACSTGKCVPPEWACDDNKDCPGGEDEDDKLCGSPRPCPEHYVACSTGQCVTPFYLCDGVKHCPDNEDEQLCGLWFPNGLLNTTTTTITKTTAPPAPPAPPAPAPCLPTLTRLRAGAACAGQTVFEEHFDSLRESVWQVEHYIPQDHPEVPFVSYQRSQVSVVDGTLRVAAALQQQQPGWSGDSIISGSLDLLHGCTRGSVGACWAAASGASIVPPVLSGRVTSRPGFAFTYGTVSVRAKLPQGDWLYPEILLEPLAQQYGLGPLQYKAGVVRVAGARGNRRLHLDVVNIGNKVLYAGPIIAPTCRNALLDSKTSRTFWGDDFHVYSVRWTPEGITMLVDGAEWGHVELRGALPPSCRAPAAPHRPHQPGAAPFDDHLCVTLGLAAGGVTEFPDGARGSEERPKPWRNEGAKAALHFWRDQPAWHATWQHPDLIVDYVKVVAL